MSFTELESLKVHVSAETRREHIQSIRSELANRRRYFGGRRLLAVVAALVLMLPVVAFAAEESVPGDLLYPVKRLFEPVIALFDPDVVVNHRLDELEQLIADGAPEERVIDSYTDASVAVDRTPHLADRFETVQRQVREDPEYELSPTDSEPDREDEKSSRSDATTTTVHRATSTTRDVDSTTSTTTRSDRDDG